MRLLILDKSTTCTGHQSRACRWDESFVHSAGRIGTKKGRARVLVSGVYFIPVMRLNILCCSRLDGRGLTTTIGQESCILFQRRANDTLTVLSREEADGLFVTKTLQATKLTAQRIADVLANHVPTNKKFNSIKSGDQLLQQQ